MDRKLVPWIVLALVMALVLGAQITWLAKDQAPMGNDATYLHLTRTLTFLHEMRSAVTGCDLMTALNRLTVYGRPALYQLMAIPFVVVGDGMEDAARGINLLFLTVGAFAVLGWGTVLGRPRAGLLGAVLFVTFPTIVGVVHDFHPHAIIPALCALTLWVLSAWLARPTVGRSWALGAMLGVGALVHPSYLALASIPALAVVVRALWCRHAPSWRRGGGGLRAVARAVATDRLVRVGLVPGLGLCGLVIAAWYLGPGLELLNAYRSWKGDEVEAFRAHRIVVNGFYEHRGRWWYLLTAPAALSAPLVLAGALAVAHGFRRLSAGRWLPSLALVCTVTICYLGETAYAWWKMASALPILALLIALAVDDVPVRWLRRSLVVALVLVATFNFAYVLFGGPWGHTFATYFGARPDSPTCVTRSRHARVFCPEAPRVTQLPASDIVRAIRREGEKLQPWQRMLLVVDDRRLQPARVAYWLAREWPDNGFSIRGIGARAWGMPYNLRYLLRSRLILYVDHGKKGVEGVTYAQATRRVLALPPPAFARAHGQVGSFPVKKAGKTVRGRRVRLMRRTRPVSVGEVAQTVRVLALPKAQMRQVDELLEEMRAQASNRARRETEARGDAGL